MSEGAGGADGFETESVEKSGAVFAQGTAVIWGGVAFVGDEIVGGEDFVPAGQAFVAVDFGDDGSGGNGAAAGVAIDRVGVALWEVDFHKINNK